MEALLVNVLHKGDKVLCIDSGKFGERWLEMAKVFGAHVIPLKIEWGKSVRAEQIEYALHEHPDLKIILTQACETSTGALHPIEKMGKIISKYPECLFLVDGITALGAMPLPMDEWHIDGLVGGSQKAFMLPTGLSLFSFSEKAWVKINHANTPRFYFDVRKEKKANDKGETFFSSNVTMIRALDVVLDLIEEQSLAVFYGEIHQRAHFTRTFAQKLGFTLFAETPSDSVTALTVPKHLDGQKIRRVLEEKYRITIMGGQDEAKRKIIRIGHMGFIQKSDMIQLILDLAGVLHEMDSGLCEPAKLQSLKKEMDEFWR